MFWIQALTEIRLINVISTLFMISRGLNLSQIYMTAVIFSVVAILSEVPSSYLADKWSRKGLITISIALGVFYWFVTIFAYGFGAFLVAIAIFSISYSFISGTDEALVYDSARELGQERGSIKMLGRFYAAPRFFKMFSPIIAVLVASNLTNSQFIFLLGIDLVANLIALFLSDFIIEPKHLQNNEKIKFGVLQDTINLFRNSSTLVLITINRTLLFLASFGIWRISSEYLTGIGASLLLIGTATTVFQASLFIVNLKSHTWFDKWSSEKVINISNYICLFLLLIFFVNEVIFRNWVIALVILHLIFIIEGIRGPFFSDLINRVTKSYNRATTISGSNLMTELIKLPALLIFSWLIYYGYGYLFGATVLLAILSVTIFNIKEQK